ncbi:MAG: dihydroorotate dehydrogenase [Candidatus Omnitrophica bacterium]|nr:dihydroorotate dehydrogenase [Candidatus Omnitrophota bacterium]
MDLTVTIGGMKFKNPLWAASGTFGCGKEFVDFLDLSEVGAIVAKTVTLNPREGNSTPRVVETPSGMLNSIGLENKGVEHFAAEVLPEMKRYGTRVIASISGFSRQEFVECARVLSGKSTPDAIEINLSCPNVKHGHTKCLLMAQDPKATKEVIRAVKKRAKAPIIAKLTPNVTDIAEIARAAKDAGADAISLVNTYFGMAIDPLTMRPLLGNVVGGLSGPAIRPMAVKAVWEVYKKVKVAIIGIGGIMNGLDVAEFMIAGANAVQIGTTNLVEPGAMTRILREYKEYLKKMKISSARNIVGRLKTGG